MVALKERQMAVPDDHDWPMLELVLTRPDPQKRTAGQVPTNQVSGGYSPEEPDEDSFIRVVSESTQEGGTTSSASQKTVGSIDGLVVFETLKLKIDYSGLLYFEEMYCGAEKPKESFSTAASNISPKNLTSILEAFYDTKKVILREFEKTRPSQRTGSSKTYEGFSFREQNGAVETQTLFIKGWADNFLSGFNEAVIHQFLGEVEGVPRLLHFAEIHLPNGRVVSTMAIEYIEGVNLWEATPDISFEKKVKTLYNVSDLLCQYHTRGIVHRDVKPDNVLLDKNGKVFVLDFGISAIKDWPYKPNEKSRVFKGSLRYISPEQIMALSEGEEASTDVYAFGSMALELLTGYAPNAEAIEDERTEDNVALKITYLLKSTMEHDRLQRMTEEERDKFSSLPDYVQDLLERSILYDPEQRPAMSEMREGFGRYFEEIRSVDVN